MSSSWIIAGQILTFISYLFFWISRFIKRKHQILFWDNISRVIAILAFVFLGTYDGIKNTLFVILRNLLGQFTNKKKKQYKLITLFALFILLILIYGLDFHGLSTICIAICGLLNLFAVIMLNEQGMRLFGMIGSVFYMGFMFFSGNITGFICELIGFCVMTASFIKYGKKGDFHVRVQYGK